MAKGVRKKTGAGEKIKYEAVSNKMKKKEKGERIEVKGKRKKEKGESDFCLLIYGTLLLIIVY